MRIAQVKKPRPFIIPLFLPHAACLHKCLFCNQNTLHPETLSPDSFPAMASLRKERDRWLAFPRDGERPLEVAFFGGNFLGFSETLLQSCLALVKEIPGAGLRFSTRPDGVSPESIFLLKASGLKTTAELGVQSLDNDVLRRAARGHNARAVYDAVIALRTAQIRVGAQMMLGLPGASEASDLESARKLALCGVDFARVAPTLVLADSGLALLHRRGKYRPLSFDAALHRCGAVVKILEDAGIPVVRIGLQTDEALKESLVAGPHHPAFGEWVRGFLLGNEVLEALKGLGNPAPEEGVLIRVSPHLRGRLQGMEGSNLKRFHSFIFPAIFKVKTEKGAAPAFWSVERAPLERLGPLAGFSAAVPQSLKSKKP